MAEFQAIVLAGGEGIALYPLTKDTPKSLLPVDNKPLLWYQLDLLENSGFQKVVVVTTEEMVQKIGQYISEEYTGRIEINLCTVQDNLETADALRQVQDKITADHFMVLAGDLITDVVLHNLADVHRIQNASVTMLLRQEKKRIHQKWTRSDDMIDCIGLDRDNRVMCISPAVHLDDNLTIPKALLKRHHEITMHTNLFDAHFYIFSRKVFEILHEKKSLSSIKADLVPYLVRRQFRTEGVQVSLAESMSHTEKRTDSSCLRAFAFVMPAEAGYCERADSTLAYQAIQREVRSKLNKS